jgi:hypothetical protein
VVKVCPLRTKRIGHSWLTGAYSSPNAGDSFLYTAGISSSLRRTECPIFAKLIAINVLLTPVDIVIMLNTSFRVLSLQVILCAQRPERRVTPHGSHPRKSILTGGHKWQAVGAKTLLVSVMLMANPEHGDVIPKGPARKRRRLYWILQRGSLRRPPRESQGALL